jgi:hypothetical protein
MSGAALLVGVVDLDRHRLGVFFVEDGVDD